MVGYKLFTVNYIKKFYECVLACDHLQDSDKRVYGYISDWHIVEHFKTVSLERGSKLSHQQDHEPHSKRFHLQNGSSDW